MVCGHSCRRAKQSGEYFVFPLGRSLDAPDLFVFLFVNSSSDLSKAEPTLTHMCIRALQKEKLVGGREADGALLLSFTH